MYLFVQIVAAVQRHVYVMCKLRLGYSRSLSEPHPSIHSANGRNTQGAACIETPAIYPAEKSFRKLAEVTLAFTPATKPSSIFKLSAIGGLTG